MKIKLPPLQSDNSRLKTNVKNKMDFIWNLTQNLSGNKKEVDENQTTSFTV
jgi:hypothetical protein